MSFIDLSIFYQLAAILVLASLLGGIAVKCKQPLIVAFIFTGLLAGPEFLNIAGKDDAAIIDTLAQFGIAVLLFMVGLKLDISLIRQTGRAALLVGIFQVLLTFLLGAALCLLLGFGWTAAALMGLSFTFSSTIIVVKLLSDKRSIDSLYGRLALGVLIVQDFIVILTMVAITGFSTAAESSMSGNEILWAIINILALVSFIFIFTRYLSKPLARILMKSAELMVVFCIAFAVLMSVVCESLHLSRELGGLLAGIMLASTPYHNVIAAKLSALRDFLLLFFFANLGAHMQLDGIEDQIVNALILSAFVMLSKPLLIMGIMRALKFRKRSGFLTGITLSQISEFSLILMAMGLSAGLVDQKIVSLVTLVGLITMGLSTYAIFYSGEIYSFLESRTDYFKSTSSTDEEDGSQEISKKKYDIIVFGLGRYGAAMAEMFCKNGFSVLGVDFNPEAIKKAEQDGYAAIYGDAADPEISSYLPLMDAKMVVFAFHHYASGPLITDLRRTLAKALRENGYQGHIAATSHDAEKDADLHRHGVDVVLSPYRDAAFHGSEQIRDLLTQKNLHKDS